MKIGDLVRHARLDTTCLITRHLQSWVGIVVGFDEDDDPIVQWYSGSQEMESLLRHRLETNGPVCEYRDTVQVI